ncbi:hypothetical protein AMTR_s00044p00093650 [Amborella trichopoda]|uniref:Uncharacterized protein n=1 Tax=Amborella trichopoda TaxID=13333 RepID=U5D6R2_AMBTC|nr:hypothetical protein AMTR_s00044p00093650 [Amborella trichopoda]
MGYEKPRFTSDFRGRRAFPFSSPPISSTNPASLEPPLNRAPPPPSFNGIPRKTHNLFLQIQCLVDLQSWLYLQFSLPLQLFRSFFSWKSSTWGLWTKPTIHLFSFRLQSTSSIYSVSGFNQPPPFIQFQASIDLLLLPPSCYYTIFYGFRALFSWKFSGRPAMSQAFAPSGLPTMTDSRFQPSSPLRAQSQMLFVPLGPLPQGLSSFMAQRPVNPPRPSFQNPSLQSNAPVSQPSMQAFCGLQASAPVSAPPTFQAAS